MNVPGLYSLIQLEETSVDDPVSSSVFNRIAAVVNEALAIAQNSAVGSLEISLLTEAQFQNQKGATWVLVDGRSVVGSVYQSTFGLTNIPDFRGLHIRGKDNGSGNNPAGDLPTGTTSGYSDNRIHTHPTTVLPTPGRLFGFWNTQITLSASPSAFQRGAPDFEIAPTPAFSIASVGVGEARPRNITVNYFIKIN